MTADGLDRARLAELADALMPADDRMPAPSACGVPGTGLDRVLQVRPDLAAPLRAALAHEGPARDVLVALQAAAGPQWTALTTCVTAAYYMTPAVRRLLGYGGQEGVVVTGDEFIAWASEGLLDPVLERGRPGS